MNAVATQGDTRHRPVNVAVVDDHAVVHEGIARILDPQPGIALTHRFSDGADALAALPGTDVDVCIVDLILRGPGGLEVVSRLRDTAPAIAALVFTVHPAAAYGVPSMKAGASGFLTKGAAPAEIIDAVRTVSDGRLYTPPDLAVMLNARDASATPPHTQLSNREFEVFTRLASGQRNSEISRELGIDQRTVSSYRRRVLDKLGVDRDAEIVRYALAHDLLGPPAPPEGPPNPAVG